MQQFRFCLLLVMSVLTACTVTLPDQRAAMSAPGTPMVAAQNEAASATEQDVPAQAVDALFHSLIADDEPGGVVMVIQAGQVQHQAAYGLADIEDATPLTTQHVFHLGSVGKQFTAMAIMQLAEQGMLAYDDPVGKYIPELAALGPAVTIRRLLHHTAGLPLGYDNEAVLDEIFSDPDQMPTNQDVIRYLALGGELLFSPGAEFEYNNVGYELLGALIERVSKQSYPAFLAENIFAPLGMTDTFALPNETGRTTALIPHSYVLTDDDTIEPYDSDPLDNLSGSGGVYSTLADLYRYDQALYTDQLVQQSTLAEAFTTALLNDGSPTDYGLGWSVNSETGEVSHSGEWLGFTSCLMRFPAKQWSVVVLFNRTYDLPDPCDVATGVIEIYDR